MREDVFNYIFAGKHRSYLLTKVGPIFMRIVLLQTGRTNEKYVADGIEIYSARIKKNMGFEIITLQDVKNSRNMTEQELREKDQARQR